MRRHPFHEPAATDPGPEAGFGMEEAGPDLDLSAYLGVLRRRWPVGAVLLLVCLVGGIVHYLVTPKMYRATTTMQIDRRSLSNFGVETPWLDAWWNMEFYPTQYKLLESRGLAERAVVSMRLYEDPVFNPAWARWSGDGGEEATPELDDLRLGRLGQRLQSGLEVQPIKNTQLVEISYRSVSPDLTARVANGVAEAFIDWGIESRTDSVGRASSFLGHQIEAIKQDIQDKEATLQGLGRRSDIVGADRESSPTMQKLEALNQDYIAAVSSRIDKEVRYNEVLNAPAETIADQQTGGIVGQIRRDVMALEQEYATKLNVYKPDWPAMVELEGKIEESRRHLQEVVDEMVVKARENARAEYQTALRRERALAEELERAKEEIASLGSATVDYNNLKMEIETRRQLLDELLQRQSETEVASRVQSTRESNVRIVDRALVPRSPYLPSLRKDLGMAAALGLFLGLGCMVLLEYLDRTIKTADEAERALGLPVLAVIPDIAERGGRYGGGYGSAYGARKRGEKKKRRSSSGGIAAQALLKKGTGEDRQIELLPLTKPRHAISEAYRSLRTAMLLSTADDLRIVALTSAQSGEGKTVTASNLAIVLAQLGKKVLLVDADLRKPRIHRLFDVPNRLGLVHVLTGGETLEAATVGSEVAGLDVVPSGTIPPNPSELLASERMRELLMGAEKRYDVIVIDTPPLLAVTDAALVGAMADGVVVCLHAGKVLRDEAKASCDRLRLSGIRILGTVLNRYVPIKGGDGKHDYYYSYQAYGEDRDESTAGSAA